MKTHGKVARVAAAMAAIALSGTVFANHKEGHNNGPGPKFSVDVENICTVVNQDPATGAGLFLKVESKIKDMTGDFDDPANAPAAEVSVKLVDAQQFVQRDEPPKKKDWTPVGAQNDSLENTVYINLCDSRPLSPDAKALNASIQVTVDGRNFNGRCDDDELNNEYDDMGNLLDPAMDESRIDLEDPKYDWVVCPPIQQ